MKSSLDRADELEVDEHTHVGIEPALGKSTYVDDRLIGVALLVRNGIFRVDEDAEM